MTKKSPPKSKTAKSKSKNLSARIIKSHEVGSIVDQQNKNTEKRMASFVEEIVKLKKNQAKTKISLEKSKLEANPQRISETQSTLSPQNARAIPNKEINRQKAPKDGKSMHSGKKIKQAKNMKNTKSPKNMKENAKKGKDNAQKPKPKLTLVKNTNT